MKPTLSFEHLSELYVELALKFAEENYVECGFKQATDKQNKIISKIRSGKMSKQDLAAVEPIFEWAGININNHITPKKIFWWF